MYLSDKEKKLSHDYLNKGFVIYDVKEKEDLNWIKNSYVKIIKKILPKIKTTDPDQILNNIHKFISPSKLNDFRLEVINQIHKKQCFKKKFYEISKNLLHSIVGNELVMQLRVSLSIQLPKDESSLLPVHADTWTGVSPYESVIWMPLVDCFKSKSMFILPASKSKKLKKIFSDKKINKSDDIYNSIKKDLVWLDVKFGQIVIFDHSLPHGNIVNKELETRWSMNCRFKSIFTPYKDKRLGEYYEPITLKPASRRGMEYKFPK